MCTETRWYTGTFDSDHWATGLLYNPNYHAHQIICICCHVSFTKLWGGSQGHDLSFCKQYSAQRDALLSSALFSSTSEIYDHNSYTFPMLCQGNNLIVTSSAGLFSQQTQQRELGPSINIQPKTSSMTAMLQSCNHCNLYIYPYKIFMHYKHTKLYLNLLK